MAGILSPELVTIDTGNVRLKTANGTPQRGFARYLSVCPFNCSSSSMPG